MGFRVVDTLTFAFGFAIRMEVDHFNWQFWLFSDIGQGISFTSTSGGGTTQPAPAIRRPFEFSLSS